MIQRPDGSFEKSLLSSGFGQIAGLDEVGRGAIAGPVVVCCIVMTPNISDFLGLGIADSKILTPGARERVAKYLERWVPAYSFGESSVDEIDSMNIRKATFLAMIRAIKKLPFSPDILLVDGRETIPENYFEDFSLPLLPQREIVGGDRSILSIAAASIMAKVARDRMMVDLDTHYPSYHFKQNKGYGTEEHRNAMVSNGLSPFHRRTFSSTFLSAK